MTAHTGQPAMRFGSLFSGIGGLDLGLEWAGMECIWQSEIDPYASRVLAKHWPNVPNFGDIRAIKPEDLPSVDLVGGGYPCQPFSAAGNRKGQKDDRHLWPIMRQVIASVRPTWVLCENVVGHITRGLDSVLSDLEIEGYSCWPVVISSRAVGGCHSRERVFIIGHSNCLNVHPVQKIQKRSDRKIEIWDRSIKTLNDDFKNDWEISHGRIFGVDDGSTLNMDRIKSIGNAVDPTVAYELGRAIVAAHTGQPAPAPLLEVGR